MSIANKEVEISTARLDKTVKLRNRENEDFFTGEILAQKTSPRSGCFLNTTNLVKELKEEYRYAGKAEIDKVITASQAIERLSALGLSHREIIPEFARAKYDSESADFPKMTEKIKELAKREYLSLHDVDTAADIMRVKREVELQKAAKIAREELEKLREQNQNI